MLTYRFLISFLSTVGIYIALGFLYFSFSTLKIGMEETPKESIISFSLASYEPEVIPPIEEVIPEEVSVEEPVIEEVIPEPIIEKVMIKPLPTVKKPIKKKVKIRKKKLVKKVVKKKKAKKKAKRKNVKKVKSREKVAKASSKREASPAKKNAFYAKVRAKIKRNKTYPRIAQRRGMQGSVKVKFTILRNGNVSNIQVLGKKVFYKSARKAIQKAFPISTKNIPVSLPTTVNLTLRYHLR